MSGVAQRVHGRLWRPSRPLTDTAVVVGLCAVATALALTPALRGLGPPGAAHTVLTVATAAAATGAAILAEVAGRIRDDPRWSWMAGSFALYGVLVLPVSVLAAGGDTPHLMLVRVIAYPGSERRTAEGDGERLQNRHAIARCRTLTRS